MTTLTTPLLTEEEIRKVCPLLDNPQHIVDDLIKKLNIVESVCKSKHPKMYKEMKSWSNEFVKGFQDTNKIQSVSKLHYLVTWVEHENDGDAIMGYAVFLPKEFQVLLAKHFIGKQ
jgi:hypothetical protein